MPDERDPLDRYYTDPRVADAVLRRLVHDRHDALNGGPWLQDNATVLEPGVGGGAWLYALRKHSAPARVLALDLDPDAPGGQLADRFLHADALTWRPTRARQGWVDQMPPPQWVIGNPVYGAECEAHVRHYLEVSGRWVVLLLRSAWLQSQRRYPWLWGSCRPREVWPLIGRPGFHREADGWQAALEQPAAGNDVHDYSVVVWDTSGVYAGTRVDPLVWK